MNEPRQRLYAKMGDSGCLTFALIHIAELVHDQYLDAFWLWREAVARGLITEECYVNDLGAFLSMVTGRSWKAKWAPKDYLCAAGEYEILRYEWKDTSVTHTHFVNGDGKGNIENDPFNPSLTVKNGQIESKRILWEE